MDSSIITVLAIILLILIGFGVYIGLQQWYKYNYEKHLFGNRNDLFNLLNYIDVAKKKGKEIGEIRGSLKKAGWSSEKVDYAIKKYSGGKTGMLFEIPVDKIIEKLKFGKKTPPEQKFALRGGRGFRSGSMSGSLKK